MGLREGKNREIKRVLEHLGLEVNRLIRLSFGPFQLGDIDEGALEEVKTRVLRDQLGPVLARGRRRRFRRRGGRERSACGGRAAGPAPRRARRRGRRPRGGNVARGRKTARTTRARRARAGRTPPARAIIASFGAPCRDPQKTGAGAAQAYFGAAQRGFGTGGRAHAHPAQRDRRPQRAHRPGRAAGRRAAGERAKGTRGGTATRRPPRAAMRAASKLSAGRARTRPNGRCVAPAGALPPRGARAHQRRGGKSPKNPMSSRRSNARPKASREARRGASGAKGRAKAAETAPEASVRRSRAGLMTPQRTGRGRSFGAARTPGRSGSTSVPARPERRAGAPRAQSATARGRESPRGPKSAGRSFAGKGERASGPASGFRGKDKAPGGKGRPGGGPGSGPRGRPGGKPGGAPRGAPRGGPGGGSGGGPGKGRPRGKS